MPIRVLPPHLVNQIAAGEVVDRPASVVKELVENALDAGASRIEIAIEGGGRDLIRVTDDGSGIPAGELPLAIAPHATSKITSPEDLVGIGTMGFRGEALASISSVARVSIVSRTRDADAAAELLAEGERVEGPRPASGPPGTTVVVRTLFFNTPARRKFLKSESAEGGRVADLVESIALAHPQVRFVLRSGERTVLDLAPTLDPRRRVLDVLGAELDPKLLLVDSIDGAGDGGGITIWGLVGRPELAKPSAKQARLHLNGRPIVDRALLHAVREAFRGLVEPQATPLAALFLELDPTEVDVNVHPAKTEVRFRNGQAVHQAVLRSVRRSLRAADLVPAFDLERTQGDGDRRATFEHVAHGRPFGGGGLGGAVGGGLGGGLGGGGGIGPAPVVLSEAARRLPSFDRLESELVFAARGRDVGEGVGTQPAFAVPVRAVEILQVHDAFVVTQDAEGLLIVDQHALHERVMFERLLARVRSGPLERQPLLVPAVLEATRAELETAEERSDLCTLLGLELVQAGPRALAVQAFPTLLFERGVDPSTFVREFLARPLPDDGRATEAALAETLDMMACKAAIKAGDRLSLEELRDLLALREAVERSTNCPHGRPTSLRISVRDLERQFGRS